MDNWVDLEVKHQATNQLLVILPKLPGGRTISEGFCPVNTRETDETHGKDSEATYKEFVDELIDPRYNPIKCNMNY